MGKAWAALRTHIQSNTVPDLMMDKLKGFQKELVDKWVGTQEQPGAITRMLLAGAAAGNRSLQVGKAANPTPMKTAALTGQNLGIDWTLLSDDAIAYAQSYTYDLIKDLDDTTRDEVSVAVTNWLQSGQPLSALEGALGGVFDNAVRASNIAQTESTRAYNQGAKERWTQAGVKTAVWQTVNVGLKGNHDQPGDVCEICSPLHGQEYDLEKGVWSDVLGEYVFPPVHPRCRCFGKPKPPAIEDVPEEVKKLSMPDALKEKRAELQRIQDELVGRMNNMLQTDKIRHMKEDMKQQRKLLGMPGIGGRNAATKLKELKTNYQKEVRKAFVKAVAVENPARITIEKATGTFPKTMIDNAKSAADFLNQIIDRQVHYSTKPVYVRNAGGRANYGMDGTINMADFNQPGDYAHEMGHWIEDSSADLHQKCIEFLQYRTKGEKIVFINGKESVKPDRFPDKYSGRIYQRKDGTTYATEILSMGLQYMYNDPLEFAERDPEYFQFILGVIQGII